MLSSQRVIYVFVADMFCKLIVASFVADMFCKLIVAASICGRHVL